MPGVAYTRHGRASPRPPLLLTHGFGASQAMWAPNLGALATDRQAITWDLPGHGASAAAGELTHERCMGEMLALLDLLGDRPAALCGMSLGGYLSLLFCARHPERVAALLLVDTGPGFRDAAARKEWNAWAESFAQQLEERGPAALSESPETAGAKHASGGAGLAAAARGILTQRDGEVFASLQDIAVPVLIVVGAQDERFLTAAGAMARRIPGASELVIENAGHASNMDQPARFNRAALDFLEAL